MHEEMNIVGVHKLVECRLREECVALGQQCAGYDMILDESAKRLAVLRPQVLLVRQRNVVRLTSCCIIAC
jgi:hypothetical protein